MKKNIKNCIKKLTKKESINLKINKKLSIAILFSLLFFIIYFTLGCIFSLKLNSIDKYNLFFGADSPRVFIDLTQVSDGHYRTIVHPLFVLLFQPIVHIFNIFIKNNILSSLLLQSVVGAFSIGFFYLILEKLKIETKLKYIFALIYGLSFSQIVFNATFETYVFAQLFLIILFYYALCRDNKKITNWDIVFLISIGVVNLGITLTNYFIYILVIIYLLIFNRTEKKSKKIIMFFILIFSSASIAITLSEIQAVFFESSSLFFKDNLYNFLYGNSEELMYIESFSINSIINQIKTVFFNGFFSPKIYLVEDIHNLKLSFGYIYLTQKILGISFWLLTFTIFILFLKNNRKKHFEHKYLILLIISFIFNFILHTFYGNSESFIYTLHYQFLLVLIISYLYQYIYQHNIMKKFIQKKYFRNIILIILSMFVLMELIFNSIGVLNMYKLINNTYGCININFNILFIVPTISIIIIILLLKIKKNTKIKIFILLFIISLISIVGYNVFFERSFIYKEYKNEYKEYTNQLRLMAKEFDVKVAYENKDDNFFLFGMGNRRKLVYQNGKIYDLETNELVASYNIKKEMIIPNEYTVVLKTEDDKIIKIYENEESIFIKENKDIINLDENACKINLPEFDNYKYSEILKVLHHELLFNIENNIIKPNILVYSSGWYRDGMLGAMVLDITNNTNLIKEWIDNITEVYDRQNGVEEADNLGELLYLLHITGSKNKIKEKVLNEIERIKSLNNNYIVGYTDGQLLSYYPTVIAKYAAEQSGIELDLSVPDFDGYSTLTWFYKNEIKPSNSFDYIHSPYICWATYHTNNTSNLYIADSTYPLSYEQGATYANYSLLSDNFSYYKSIVLSPTHVWDASEKFLFLIEQN